MDRGAPQAYVHAFERCRATGPRRTGAAYADPVTETASWARRILALFVDWIAATLVVIMLVGPDGWSGDPLAGFYVLTVFAAESTVLTALTGGSFGKLVTRLRVVGSGGGPPDLLRSLLRAVLVCLVVPPLVFKPDGRGLHDLAVGTRTVPLPPRP